MPADLTTRALVPAFEPRIHRGASSRRRRWPRFRTPMCRRAWLMVAGESVRASGAMVAGESDCFNLYGPTEATIWTTAVACANDGVPPTDRPSNCQRRPCYVLDERSRPWRRRAGRFSSVAQPRDWLFQPAGPLPRRSCRRRLAPRRERLVPFGTSGVGPSEGDIEFIGRVDHQVKLRGFRIELGEIESRLRTASDWCAKRSSIVRDDDGDDSLIAYIVRARGLGAQRRRPDDVRAAAAAGVHGAGRVRAADRRCR